RASAVNLAVLRRARIAGSGLFAVVVHQRPRLRSVYVEPLAHRVLAIVVALDQRLSVLVVAALDLRRIEFHMIAAPRGGMHAPAAHARDERIVGTIALEAVVRRP